MKIETYTKIMAYIDLIEVEIGIIATEFCHPSFEEFFTTSEKLKVALYKFGEVGNGE